VVTLLGAVEAVAPLLDDAVALPLALPMAVVLGVEDWVVVDA
jgi:hypothetical protein